MSQLQLLDYNVIKSMKEKSVDEKSVSEKFVNEKSVNEKSVKEKFVKEKFVKEKFVKKKFVKKKFVKEKSVTKIQKIMQINNAIYDNELTIITEKNSLSLKHSRFARNSKISKILRISDFEILFRSSRSRNSSNRLAQIRISHLNQSFKSASEDHRILHDFFSCE